MTSAPANLLAVRALLREHLHIDAAALGITGDAAHRGGYHCGSDRVVTNDYSVVESPRDRAGLTLDASALDVGLFAVTIGARTHTLPTLSTWLVGQCVADAPDTRDIREVIYSPDGKTVKRWDRLRKRSTGDSSHLFHTHISFFRDAIRAGRDLTPLFRRYLTYIGLIQAPTPEDDVDTKQNALLYNASSITASIARMEPEAATLAFDGKAGTPVRLEIVEAVQGLQTAVADLAKRPGAVIDYDQLADAIVRRVLTDGTAAPQAG